MKIRYSCSSVSCFLFESLFLFNILNSFPPFSFLNPYILTVYNSSFFHHFHHFHHFSLFHPFPLRSPAANATSLPCSRTCIHPMYAASAPRTTQILSSLTLPPNGHQVPSKRARQKSICTFPRKVTRGVAKCIFHQRREL